MANRPAVALELREGDREQLMKLKLASQRARIVLLAVEGEANTAIAAPVGVSRPTEIRWRSRYAAHGFGDEVRSGRPRTLQHQKVVAETLQPPPEAHGVTHRLGRLSGEQLNFSTGTVVKARRDYGVGPWRFETIAFSTGVGLVAKITGVLGLHLASPQNTIVLCINEKSQMHALDRTAPMLPMPPGLPERRTHERHGTPTLFAALEIAAGRATGAVKPRHRHHRFLAFLKQPARAHPEGELPLVMDNDAAHKRVEVRDWLTADPRIRAHVTLASGSGLGLVEVWFGIIERQMIHPGTVTSVRDLDAKIRAFVNGWNGRRHLFVWTMTVGDVLKRASRQATSASDS